MEAVQRITELTEKWYLLIGPEHHKDRDCHWYITTSWSYGQPPTYTVEHNGYIGENISLNCENYDAALQALQNVVTTAIAQEREHQTLENTQQQKITTMNNLPQKLQENLLVLLEAARVGLDDADLFDYIAEQLDMADEELSDIRDSLQTYLDSEAHD